MAEGYLIPADPEGFETPQYAYSVIPNTFSFGNHIEQTTEPTTSIQITNTGTDPLSFTFTDSTNFYTNDLGFTLTSGQTQAFIINAKTNIIGLHLETIFVNESNAGNKSIALSSNIIAIPQYQYSFDPQSWDFGTHDQGSVLTKEILITSEGTQPLTFTFTDSTNFYTNDTGFTLTQGQTQGFIVNALTDNVGVHSEFMSINQVEAGNSNLALQSEILEVPFTSGTTVITASGNFDVPVGTTLLEYTIVAGGGGGGSAFGDGTTRSAGSGGAGGMLEGSISNPTAGLTPVVVGAGGAGGAGVVNGANNGVKGSDSSILGITATGGGYGGGSHRNGFSAGGSGGSGGGTGVGSTTTAGGAGIVGQGNNGGNSSTSKGGGGGGKSTAANSTIAGNGQASSINGIVYAKGGTSSTVNSGGIAGAANTGNGGGGGASQVYAGVSGGAGGSGIVVLRWT